MAPDGGGTSFCRIPGNPTGQSLGSSQVEMLPDSTYHCLELVLNVAPDGGTLSLFRDPQTPQDAWIQMTGVSTTSLSDAGWDSVLVGLPFATGDAGTDLLVDSVTISLYSDQSPTAHIGCP